MRDDDDVNDSGGSLCAHSSPRVVSGTNVPGDLRAFVQCLPASSCSAVATAAVYDDARSAAGGAARRAPPRIYDGTRAATTLRRAGHAAAVLIQRADPLPPPPPPMPPCRPCVVVVKPLGRDNIKNYTHTHTNSPTHPHIFVRHTPARYTRLLSLFLSRFLPKNIK